MEEGAIMVKKWQVTIPKLSGTVPRRVYLYLPDSYKKEPEKRYPVMYMFDGHNVFFDSDATYGKSWGMKKYMDKYDDEKTEDHRPGRYYEDGTNNGKVRVITAAGKIVNGNGNNASKTEGYWIYAREDQINWILQGDDLPRS